MPDSPVEPSIPVDRNGSDLVELEQRAVRWWQPLALLLVLGLLFLIGDRAGLRGELSELRAWIESLGVQGPVWFVAAYLALTVVGFPSSPLTAAAGTLFGAAIGSATAMAGATAAMLGCFLVTRHLAPARLRQRLLTTRSFRHVDRLVLRHPVLVVLMVRLANILPFAMVNYGFGLTRVRFGTYALWSILGKAPGTIVMVVGIDVMVESLHGDEVPWTSVVVVLLMAAALAVALRKMNRRLKELKEGETRSPRRD